jgi:hypothetical protein
MLGQKAFFSATFTQIVTIRYNIDTERSLITPVKPHIRKAQPSAGIVVG